MADEEAKGQEPEKKDDGEKKTPFDQEEQKPSAEATGFESLPAETQAEIKRLRAEAAQNRVAAQEAKAKVEEFENANATELEKAQKKAAKLEQEKAEADAKLLRFEIASEKDVPQKAVKFLSGTTREELEAQADELIELAAKPETPDFDGGVRDPAGQTRSPEDQHNRDLLQMLGRAPQQQRP